MKPSKIILCSMIVTVMTITALALNEGMAETPIFKDYQVVEVRPFEVPLNVPAEPSAGRDLGGDIERYLERLHLYHLIVFEDRRLCHPLG